MPGGFLIAARGLLLGAVLVILVLTFVWPFAVGADPASAGFRVIAIAAFVVFLTAVGVLAAGRLRAR